MDDLRAFGDLRIPHPPTGVPLLDRSHAPSGRWNAHAFEYLLLSSKYYEPDGRYLVSHYPGEYARSVAIAYALLIVGYVASVSLLISCGDFSRYRFDLDPFHLLFSALLFSDLVRASVHYGKLAAGRFSLPARRLAGAG